MGKVVDGVTTPMLRLVEAEPDSQVMIRFRIEHREPCERVPHPVTGDYVRRWWCSVLGPTATLALISLALSAPPKSGGVVTVPAAELGCLLGVGTGTGKNAVLMRAIERLVKFKAIKRDDDGVLVVPTHLRPLDYRYEDRLTPRLAAAHRRMYGPGDRDES